MPRIKRKLTTRSHRRRSQVSGYARTVGRVTARIVTPLLRKIPGRGGGRAWFKQPIFLMGIGGAVIGLILLFVLSPAPATSWATTTAGGEQAVVEQASNGSVEVGGDVFYLQGRLPLWAAFSQEMKTVSGE